MLHQTAREKWKKRNKVGIRIGICFCFDGFVQFCVRKYIGKQYLSNTVFLMVIERSRKTRLNLIKTEKYLDSDLSVSSSYLVYSRLKPSLVSVLISVLISVFISFSSQTRYVLV